MEEYRKFIENAKLHYPHNIDKIQKAFEFSNNAHKGITRKSGEPYIIHPLAVAQILIDNKMDYETIMAGLLHDVVEDTKYTLDDIKNNFGETVAKLVNGMTKIDNVTQQRQHLTEADSIKRLLIAMGDDIRVIFIKLADRLHNMRTIEFLKRDRQIRMALETKDLFIPIAERIGIRSIRSQLEEAIFKCLHPEEYDSIKNEFDRKYQKRLPKINDIEANLKKILKENDVDGKIFSWPEHYYSIYKKYHTDGIGKIYGMILFKVIVPTELDCYKTLGLLHKNYKHIPSQIIDYISTPKPNGYRSLNSILMTDNVTFKVLIRTPEMDDVCEYGVSAIWKNSEYGATYNQNIEKYNHIKDIVLEESVSENSLNFINAIKAGLSQSVTWAFTPKLAPVSLDADKPTAIDFAYAVHTNIGNNAIGAIVNGKKESLGVVIHSGDVVEIITSNEDKSPSRNWISVVKTPLARKKIREYIRKNTTPENVELGKDMLSKALEGTSFKLEDISYFYPKISEDMNFLSIDDLFASIGYKSITLQQITKYFYDDKKSQMCQDDSPVVIEGVENCENLTFPKCCSVIPGDEIVASKTKFGYAIHSKNCANISRFEKDKIFCASWKQDIKDKFSVNIKIIADNNVGVGANILGFLANEKFNLSRLQAKTLGNNSSEFELTFEVKNRNELDDLMKKLNDIDGIKAVRRV